jgi:hypothetical protein
MTRCPHHLSREFINWIKRCYVKGEKRLIGHTGSAFLAIIQCSPLTVNGRLGGGISTLSTGLNSKQSKKQESSREHANISSASRNKPGQCFTRCQKHVGFFIGLLFKPADEIRNSSETLVDFERTTRRYISEDMNLHNQNFKSYIIF